MSRIDSENIQLLCRLRNLKNVLTFCRFERDGNFGINLRDGTVQGNYRYFGDGFDKGHCGLEINRIAGTDKTQWRCFVGATDIDDFNNMKIADAAKRIHKYSAVIDASDAWDKLKSLYEEGEGRETLNVGAPGWLSLLAVESRKLCVPTWLTLFLLCAPYPPPHPPLNNAPHPFFGHPTPSLGTLPAPHLGTPSCPS